MQKIFILALVLTLTISNTAVFSGNIPDNISNINTYNNADNMTEILIIDITDDNLSEGRYSNELFKRIPDDNITDEDSANEWLNRYYEDIFIFNETPMSANIPSSYFFKARLIHNNPDKSEYEKQREFYILTDSAVDAFYSYAIELSEGARDIENCEDEVEAMLAFLQIINANDHGYRDLVQPEKLYKISDIFTMIDVVVKNQVTNNIKDKKNLASVYEYPIDEFDLTDEELKEFLPALYALESAKKIHQSKKSEYEKKREILSLLYDELPRIHRQIEEIRKHYDKRTITDDDNFQLRSALGFMQVISDNKYNYRELVSGDDIELLRKLIYEAEIMLGLKKEVIEYLEIIM